MCIMCVMFFRRFEPRGRRFTNFHYYYCCYNDDADDYNCYGHYYYSYAVKKYTKIIKLTNLEGHARVHNTQQTPFFVTTFYVTAPKMQVVLWLIYGLLLLDSQANTNTRVHTFPSPSIIHTHSHVRVQRLSSLIRPELSQYRS